MRFPKALRNIGFDWPRESPKLAQHHPPINNKCNNMQLRSPCPSLLLFHLWGIHGLSIDIKDITSSCSVHFGSCRLRGHSIRLRAHPIWCRGGNRYVDWWKGFPYVKIDFFFLFCPTSLPIFDRKEVHIQAFEEISMAKLMSGDLSSSTFHDSKI